LHLVGDFFELQDHKFTKLPHAFQNMKMVSNKIYGHNYNLQLQWLAGWLAAPLYGIFLTKSIHTQLYLTEATVPYSYGMYSLQWNTVCWTPDKWISSHTHNLLTNHF